MQKKFLCACAVLIIPWLSFFFIKRYIAGIFCLFLQGTLIGWPIASIWGLSAVGGAYEKVKKYIEDMLILQAQSRKIASYMVKKIENEEK